MYREVVKDLSKTFKKSMNLMQAEFRIFYDEIKLESIPKNMHHSDSDRGYIRYVFVLVPFSLEPLALACVDQFPGPPRGSRICGPYNRPKPRIYRSCVYFGISS